eukprot:c19965_g1_i2 orf=664-2889(-)
MDLSLRSLTAAPLQMQRRGTHKEPFSCCATSQLCLLAQKSRTRVVRCSIAEEGREPAQESSPAKGGAPASWLQADAASDPFFGWTSDNSQTNHSSKAGWIKVGGGVVLAIGFALGAQAFYARRGATKISAALLPVTEQIISSPKTSESSEKQGVLDQDRQLQTDGAVPKVQQEESTSAGLPKTLGRVLVPASVDHMQEQLLAALQALKVIEAGVQPGDICTRREYARWLIAASARLSRSPADKVFPAMYIENVSRLAYADVLPEDRDFPYIQGLAEAGLITSRLFGDDTQQADDGNSVFSPDSPLTRQDLIAWKGAFERKTLISPEVSSLDSKKALQELSGFVDADKIRQDAWPALLADINAGKCSIIASAFGYTRRFQPEKPVTNAQAAVALATGDAWELVSEELARLEAESIAEAAVVAELAMETKAQEEVAAAFNELLQAEREKLQESASLVEKLQAELEQVKTDWEEEKYALLKERAALDSEKEILSNTRREVEQQALLLSNAKLELSFQREQVDKLHTEAEEERAMTSKIRSELEVEKNALTLARAWAEEEARRALVHSKLLEQVRARWEYQGVQVHVDKELDEVNIPGPSWRYSEDFHSRSSPMDRLVTKSKDTINSLVTKSTDIGHVLKDALLRFFHFIVLICQAIRTRSTELARGLREKLHEAKINLADSTTNTMAGIKQTLPSSVTDMTASIREGTLKAATDMTVSIREGTLKAVADCKGGAERLAHKFKVS